jgi:segregation and condensation protein B
VTEPRQDEESTVQVPARVEALPEDTTGVASARRGAELEAVVEALVYASPDPLSVERLCRLLDTEPPEDVEAALDSLKVDYDRPGGLRMVQVAGGYQIVTRPEFYEWVRRLFHEPSTQKLSVAALETLAVVAYKQPVTAPEISEIRGVNTSGVLSTLLERELITIVGRKQVVGRPFMYGTTQEFLVRFGLSDLDDLPKMEEMAESLGFDLPAGLVDFVPMPAPLLAVAESDDEIGSEIEEPREPGS